LSDGLSMHDADCSVTDLRLLVPRRAEQRPWVKRLQTPPSAVKTLSRMKPNRADDRHETMLVTLSSKMPRMGQAYRNGRAEM
jgi:hypothetical protein